MNTYIKDDIYNILCGRAKEQGYENVDEYINFLLNQIAKKINVSNIDNKDNIYSKEEEENIKNRLQSLGYID